MCEMAVAQRKVVMGGWGRVEVSRMWNTEDVVVTECWGGSGKEEESVREVSRLSVRGLDGCATPKMRNPKGEAD